MGSKTYLLVNREKYNNTFGDELKLVLKEKKQGTDHRPQFFFLHGPHEELPGSLADRFYEFTVRDILDGLKEPLSPGKYVRYEMGFPQKSDFESTRNRDMAFIRLQSLFEKQNLDSPEHGRDLLKRIGPHRRVVLIQHDIMALNWHEKMPEFLMRYMTDFWGMELNSNQPQVVVVFNLTYHLAKGFSGFLKKRADKSIEKSMQKLANNHENCFMIHKLEPVESDDVALWQGDYLKEKPKLVQQIFGRKNKLPMAEIEPILMEALKGY